MEKIESPRRQRRKARLEEIIEEVGSASDLAREIGTPKSHVSAMVTGRRGVGDDIAAKIERHYKKPEGWFDSATATLPGLPTTPLYTEGAKQDVAHTQQAKEATDIEASLHCLRMAALRIDDADRDALASYVSKMIREPDRADLVPRALNILSPPAHKAMPETGAKRAA